MKKFCLLFLFIMLFTFMQFTITASAHPGRTDANGGHWDYSTGTYHYHDGSNAGGSNSISDGSYSSIYLSEQYKEGYKTGYAEGYDQAERDTSAKVREAELKIGDSIKQSYTISVLVGCFILFLCFNLMKKSKNKALTEQERTYKKNAAAEKAIRDAELSKIVDGANAVQKALYDYIGNEYLYILCDAPDDDYLDENGLPHSDSNPLLDKYIFYLGSYPSYSRSKYPPTKFHCQTCRYAKKSYTINALEIEQKGTYDSCSFCKPTLPDMQWVYRYKEMSKLFDKCNPDNIPPREEL